MKREALAKFLGCSVEDLSNTDWTFSVLGKSTEYMVVTNEEADKLCRMCLRDALWTFDTDLLALYIPSLYEPKVRQAFAKMQEELGEAIHRMLIDMISQDNFDRLVRDAKEDGRGALLAIDKEEHEVLYEGVTYYVFREV